MNKEIKLKAGLYYVGDPQYIFKKSWDIVSTTEGFYYDDEVTKLFGVDCFTAGTFDGDGTYEDNDGRSYGIDSGMLCVVPVELLSIDNVYTIEQVNSKDFMHIIEFKNDFNVCVDDGVFLIGNITIDTYVGRNDDNLYYDECFWNDSDEDKHFWGINNELEDDKYIDDEYEDYNF